MIRKTSTVLPFVFLCINFFLVLQGLDAQTTKGQLTVKEKKLYDEGKKHAQQGNFKKSNDSFEKLLKTKTDFTEGILRLASNYFAQKQYQNAEALFLNAVHIEPEYDPEMYYSLAMVQKEMGKLTEAIENLGTYGQKETKNLDKVNKANKLKENLIFTVHAKKNPVPFKPINMGENINTTNSEYTPLLSLDGKHLIFTRNVKRPTDFIGQEDLFMAEHDGDNWKKAYPVTDINTSQNEGAFAISANGKYIVFTACDRKDAFGSCDLYYSMLMDGNWTAPVNMGHKVNSAAWDSQPTLSADGRTLLFASRRLGTYGGSDIFMTYKDHKNSWVTPVNLGPEINTVNDDESPFLHPDGSTLYFRTNGRPGMGGFDIFLSRKNDTTGMWQPPVNIGYPINTEGDDGSLTVSLDGKSAYYASDVNFTTGQKMNHLDIFTFELYEKARPIPTTFVKGLVTDLNTGKPLKAKVTIKELNTGNDIFQIFTDNDGYFLSGISTGKNYACIVELKDYRYHTENFDLTDKRILSEPYFLDIKLKPITKQTSPITQPTILQNIFFASGSAELKSESSYEIALIYKLMVDNQAIHVKIVGHTDDVGKAEDNLLLSQRRAKSVADAIVSLGIDAGRITSEGKGETNPISDNTTDDGRKKNRRTEMIIIE